MHVLPSFNALRAFEAAVRRGSFVAAANELHLTLCRQSSSEAAGRTARDSAFQSDRAFRLPDRQRRALLSRGHRRVRPDQGGDGGPHQQRQERPAFVHSAPSFATQWLLPRLPEFVAAHPELDVVFWATSPPYNLMASNCDIDIQYGATSTEGLDVMPFPPSVSSPCAVRLLPTASGRSALPRIFDSLIHSDHCLVRWPDWLERHWPLARSRSGIALRPVIHVDLDGRGRPRRVLDSTLARAGSPAAVW